MKPLNSTEADRVRAHLAPQLADLFFAQPVIDQRHALNAAGFVSSKGAPEEIVVAALLHDVGKRHAGLGVIGRTFASLMMLLRIWLPPRFAAYRDHGDTGAVELEEAGAPSVAIDFARHHHAGKPATFDQRWWDCLQDGDLAQRPNQDQIAL